VRAGKALEEQSSGEYRPVCRRDSAGSERTHEGVKTAESVKHSEARSQGWRASERDAGQLVKRELALRGSQANAETRASVKSRGTVQH
jgi:hypothetical protein